MKNTPRGNAAGRVGLSASPVNFAAALGTGDDDFALSTRDAADRMAVGTGEVFVLLVNALLAAGAAAALHGIDELREKPRVLGAAALQIPGEHPEQHPERQYHGDRSDRRVRRAVFDEDVHNVQQDRQPEGGHSQMIGSVAAIHKAGEGIAYLLEKVHKSASIPSIYKTIHCILQENFP